MLQGWPVVLRTGTQANPLRSCSAPRTPQIFSHGGPGCGGGGLLRRGHPPNTRSPRTFEKTAPGGTSGFPLQTTISDIFSVNRTTHAARGRGTWRRALRHGQGLSFNRLRKTMDQPRAKRTRATSTPRRSFSASPRPAPTRSSWRRGGRRTRTRPANASARPAQPSRRRGSSSAAPRGCPGRSPPASRTTVARPNTKAPH